MADSLKSILISGNRYKDVVNILSSITTTTCSEFPLYHPYIDENNEAHWRINGEKVREQANLLISLFEDNSCGDTGEDFTHLKTYISSKTEIYRLNYVVALSHDKKPEHDIDTIKQWSVLNNILDCWGDTNRDIPWYMPEAWKGKQ